mgnify:CR=1 FL=1
MDEIALRLFRAEDAPWLTERHGTLYAREAGFDATFAPLVAEIIADYLARHDPAREAGLYARNGWRIAEARPVHAYGCDLVEQTWEIALH